MRDERHLSELKSMAEATSSPSIKSMIQYSEALIGTSRGTTHVWQQRSGATPATSSPGYARWKTLSALSTRCG